MVAPLELRPGVQVRLAQLSSGSRMGASPVIERDTGGAPVGKHIVNLKNITCPVLNIMAGEDDLAPCSQGTPFNDLAGSTDRKVQRGRRTLPLNTLTSVARRLGNRCRPKYPCGHYRGGGAPEFRDRLATEARGRIPGCW